MAQEKLFRNRLNAKLLLIIVSSLTVFGFLSLVFYQIYKTATRNRQVQNVVNVESGASIESQWTLGRFERLGENDYVMAAAHSKQSYETSYYEKDASAVRNYLFVNVLDKSSRWLVSTNKYLFLTAQKLLREESNQTARFAEKAEAIDRNKAVKWIMYEVVKSDTDGDRRFTSKDRRTIAVSSSSGESYTELIENVEQILGSILRDDNTLLIFHSSAGNNYVSEVNLPERKVTFARELPKIQPE